MCFSAPVSFVASAGLAAIGGVTLSKNREKTEMPLAAIPLLLGVQQGIEGIVWMSFGMPALNSLAAYMYTFFSHLFWPVFVPFAVMYAEPDPVRKKNMRLFVYLGALVSLYLLYFMSTEPLTCGIVGHSIRYDLVDVPFPGPMTLLYLAAICGSCFMSSHKTIQLLGATLFLGFVIAYWFYFQTLFSVWCFFAAILSAIILVHVARKDVNPISAVPATK